MQGKGEMLGCFCCSRGGGGRLLFLLLRLGGELATRCWLGPCESVVYRVGESVMVVTKEGRQAGRAGESLDVVERSFSARRFFWRRG